MPLFVQGVKGVSAKRARFYTLSGNFDTKIILASTIAVGFVEHRASIKLL